jgi:hypothetical protein
MIPICVGMVAAGARGEFQFGSDDYAQWEVHRWSPMLKFGLVGLGLAIVAAVMSKLLARNIRINAALVTAAVVLAAVGVIEWHHRTYLRGDFVAAFDRLHLGPDFQTGPIAFDVVYDPDSGGRAPDAVQRWYVDLPVLEGCRAAAEAAAQWARASTPHISFESGRSRGCRFQTFYGSYRMTFSYAGRASDGRWVLEAEMDATQ